MYNYSIDTTLLPEVWVTWMSANGRIWMNKSGVRQNHAEPWMDYSGERSLYHHRSNNDKTPFGCGWHTRNNNRLWINAGSQLHYAYAKYHEDIDRLELAVVRYDSTRAETNHTWLYAGERIFIGKDKSVLDECGRPFAAGRAYKVKRGLTAHSPREMIQSILHSNCNNQFIDEFKKFLGHSYFIIGNGTSVDVEHSWQVQKWYDSKQKVRSTGKSQQLVDELIKLPLGSIEGLEYRYAPKLKGSCGYYESEYIDNIIYFERANNEWSVLRALVREEDGSFDEVWRVYLGDDGTNRIASKSNGDWIPASQNKSWYARSSYYFANEAEAIEKCNRIKYIAPMISSNDGINALITTLRFPCIEQLYKMGQQKLAMNVARSSTPKAYMNEVFGGYYKEKEKSVLRQIGMTKHQLDAYCAKRESNGRSYYSDTVIKRLRATLGDDLSRIDNVTFDKYLDAFDAMVGRFYYGNSVSELDVDQSKFWKNVVRLNDKNRNAASLISDTITTYRTLRGTKPAIDWLFDDYSDVVRAHDALVALKNEQDAEQRAYWNMEEAKRRRLDEEKRKKTDEERRHYEYEDEHFIIRLPKDVNEIVTEGSRQSICIGGYTTRHSRGETNLFFLRRKSDETTPFYAIEMNNDKQIVQIHGHCNKWLGNNPEAIPTVVRWLRKHGIKCDKEILTCTAKGYSHRNEYIEMPIVD